MPKYKVNLSGTLQVEVFKTVEIDAEDESEAIDKAQAADDGDDYSTSLSVGDVSVAGEAVEWGDTTAELVG